MSPLIGFGLVAGFLLASAVMVVRSDNLVHSVLWLSVVLVLTAVVFILLGATFLGGIQIILYTGGVITLMLFGIMLTGKQDTVEIPNPSEGHLAGAGAALAFLVPTLSAIWATDFGPDKGLPPVTAKHIGTAVLGPHLVAFEALSVLLLAAMIGAIVLARRSDPGEGR
ncbi:MAG: NADH-quinone oxidoreductase subunit J [Deltaproteobacteria bacterium]|nr:MAG: NADH-quinone oxidoreductase subunit J [Deltaproteobacteria bacterium]